MCNDILKLDLMDGREFTITNAPGVKTGTFRLRTGIHPQTCSTYFLQIKTKNKFDEWHDYPDRCRAAQIEFGDFEMLCWNNAYNDDNWEIDYSKIKVKKL